MENVVPYCSILVCIDSVIHHSKEGKQQYYKGCISDEVTYTVSQKNVPLCRSL